MCGSNHFAFITVLLGFNLVLTRALSSYDDGAHAPFEDDIGITSRDASEDKTYWREIAQKELRETLSRQLNTNIAKNVILFLGDGMGIPTVTAARIYVGQQAGERGEEGFLAFEKFPHAGLVKTYNVDYQVPDSAGTATAFLTGVKTNLGVIGLDATVSRGDCKGVTENAVLDSVAKWSQDKGKRTGFVTSTTVTHATPASLYAHSPERGFECDSNVKEGCENIKDIARQLVEDEPGRKLHVIMGGGLGALDGEIEDLPGDPATGGCRRSDGKKLWKAWLSDRVDEGRTASFVNNKTGLNSVDLENTEFLMGIFANSHIPYEYMKKELSLDLPTLAEMTEAAIKVLQQGQDGFFLLVEGGRIDHGHHGNKALRALDEAKALNDAVRKALELTDDKETLIVVTADHSHTMSVAGYPKRGNPISDMAGKGKDGVKYTTLGYANGPGFSFSVLDGEVQREDPQKKIQSPWKYKYQATVPLRTETHGGEDVSIYATGPMSHLFTSVHEQNYIALAIAYASCVDPAGEYCYNVQMKKL